MTTRLLTLSALLVAACYNPNIQGGQQACSIDGKCPEGLACAANKRCYPIGITPDCPSKCAAPTPVCDKGTLTCVGCLDDSTCPAGFICATAQKVCKPGCGKSHPGCAPDAGSCDVDMGLCHGCLDDKACGNGTPRCDVMSGLCFECLPANDNCPDGQYCDVHSCKPGCKDVASCAAPDGGGGGGSIECCAHTCADLQSDPKSCGKCGNACAQGSSCCAGACSDPATDIANCGGCGRLCNPANVNGPNCMAGACGYGACKMGFADCDKVAANGCEVSTDTDVMSCGACGAACKVPPNGKATCAAGVCAISGCNVGFADCDADVVNGCEVNLTNDVKNCAMCGRVCPNVPNGTPACKASSCGLGLCNLGFGDCDMAPGNGCEINTTTNPLHCGGCGKACVLANAVPGCVGSLCSVASCNAGFGNCDNMAANGCERPISNDVNNCGACGRVCTFANAGATCVGGACTLGVCNAGFGNCDNMAANGCEKNLNTDAANCGACGVVCAGACVNGKCGPASQTFVASGTFTVPANVRSVRVLVVGGGGGGANGHQGGGGSGVAVGATVMVNPGDMIAVTVGGGGLGAAVCNGCNNIVGNTPGGNSAFGMIASAGGGTPTVINGPGGNGGSGGGGSCNGGAPGGAGGTNGGNGGTCNQPPGNGQGNTFVTSLATIVSATMTAGAGGAGGNSSHSGGGGGGGVLLNNMGPKGGDGAAVLSAKGGVGYGAGGGAGGFDANTGPNREAGGNGAPGLVYVEW